MKEDPNIKKTIYLPEIMKLRVEHAATDARISDSALVLDALEQYFAHRVPKTEQVQQKGIRQSDSVISSPEIAEWLSLAGKAVLVRNEEWREMLKSIKRQLALVARMVELEQATDDRDSRGTGRTPNTGRSGKGTDPGTISPDSKAGDLEPKDNPSGHPTKRGR